MALGDPQLDSTQPPITAADPRIAKLLALVQAQRQAQPIAPVDPSQQIAPIAAPAPPPNVPGLSPPAPSTAPVAPNLNPAAPPVAETPAPTPVPQTKPGPVKSFLMSLGSHLAAGLPATSDALLHHAGLPTAYEKQQNALKIGLQQQQQDSLEGLRAAQANLATGKGAQLDQVMAPYSIDKDDQSVLPQFRGQATTFGGYQALQKLSGQTQGKKDVATITAQAGTVPMTPEFAQRIGMPQLAGQPVSAKTLSSYGKLLGGNGIQVADVAGRSVLLDKSRANEPGGGIIQDLGPSTRMLAAGMNAANRTVQVVNPNDPNSTIQMSPSQANRTGAQGTQSAVYQANKAITKYFTSGAGAQNLNSFNTATAHLQQLGSVADALNNGDTQLVNKLGNSFGQQTGNPAPTNFDAVKTAVAGEIGKVFKGSGATDQEISELNSTINRTESPAQLKGVIDTYTHLMNSKKEALQQQYNAGKSGTPNFNPTTTAPAHKITVGGKVYQYKGTGATDDMNSYTPVAP